MRTVAPGAPHRIFCRLSYFVSRFTVETLEGRYLLSGVGAFADDADIGSPALSGSSSFLDGTYTVTGGGSDIGGTSDQFHYLSDPFNSDGTIIARVGSIANTNGAAKAGLMFRSGTAANAAFGGVFVTPIAGVTFVFRNADGGTASATSFAGFGAPRFLKLSRATGQVSAFHSSDGVTWTQIGTPQPISLEATSRVGIAVTSRNVAATTTATFTGVSVLPNGWNSGDVGSPAVKGFSTYDPTNNRLSISGAGTGIGGTSDQFSFANHSMTGDGSVIARIDSLSAADTSAEAGVMIRNDQSATASFAAVEFKNSGDLVFKWRASTGASVSSATAPSPGGPVWLKLSQVGGSFTASYSTNSISWTQIGANQMVSLSSSNTLGGLVVSSHNTSAFADATFSGVSLVQGGWSNIDIGAPALPGSAVFEPASNTHTVTGSGSDVGGTSDQFTFVRGGFSGDGSLVGYVNSISASDSSAKAGVMFRADDNAGAAFAAVYVTPANGLVAQWRTSNGTAAQQQLGPAVAAPVSLKITRSGNTFAFYYSIDGTSWIAVGPAQPVSMPSMALAGIALTSHGGVAPATAYFTGTAIGNSLPPGAGIYSAADELFLNDLEQRTVRFFYDETNPNTGLVPDGALANGGSNGSACSIASLGFGLTALTIGDRRGWLSHNDAYQRALTTINFLYNTAAQVNGFFYHFLNPVTGARSPGSELSSVDTAELMAGVLNVAQYWSGTPLETAAMNVFNRVNWPFMLNADGQFYGGWSPEGSFEGGYVDFSEAVVLYLLGLGSATHPIPLSSWTAWSRSPSASYAGISFLTASTRALFTVQYPMAWYDLRNLVDGTGVNYFENAKRATLAQRQWMSDLSGTYPHWGPNTWGLTASDSAFGYAVWGGPPAAGPIDGTVVPTGPGGSLAFTPRQSVDALRNMQQVYGSTIYRKYAFVDAFNPHTNWTSSIVLGIDQGMMLAAAENSRSNFVWDVFMQTAVARQSMAAAFPVLKPTLLSAVSRKLRTDAVVVDSPISLSGGKSIENHQGGPTQLVLNFETNIVKGPAFAAFISNGVGSVTGSTVNGSTLILNLSGVADAQTITLNIDDVRHYSNTAGGSYSFNLGVLTGDADQNGLVDVTDLGILASNWQVTSPEPLQADFDLNGTVDVGGLGILATNWQIGLSSSFTRSSPFASPGRTPLTSQRRSRDPVFGATDTSVRGILLDQRS
jgi:hypothetical protein